MTNRDHPISLGFTQHRFQPGVHVCQIYTSEEERQQSALQFLLSGLRGNEKTSCFSDKVAQDAVREFLEASGISCEEAMQSGALTLSGTRDVYFRDQRFDPERMLNLLKQYYHQSMAQHFRAARVIGDMAPEVQHLPGGEALLEYESKVSLLLRECPITTVCQYSAQYFSGAAIMDILKVHPFMVVRGCVVHNPFFIPPEEFLGCQDRKTI